MIFAIGGGIALGIATGSVWLGLAMFLASCLAAQLLYMLVLVALAWRGDIRAAVRRGLPDFSSDRDNARR